MAKAAFNIEKGFDSMMFEVFLVQLDRYLAWESKAGGPYMYMRNIAYPDPCATTAAALVITDYTKLLALYHAGEIDLPIDLVVQGNTSVVLQLDQHHPNFITLMDKYSCSRGKLSPGRQDFTTTKDKNQEIKLYLNIPRSVRMRETPTDVGTFNGRRVNICVRRPTHTIVSNQGGVDLVANPIMIEMVANKINTILKEYSNGKAKQQELTSKEVIRETVTDAPETKQSNYYWGIDSGDTHSPREGTTSW